jgi:hypothetical protein
MAAMIAFPHVGLLWTFIFGAVWAVGGVFLGLLVGFYFDVLKEGPPQSENLPKKAALAVASVAVSVVGLVAWIFPAGRITDNDPGIRSWPPGQPFFAAAARVDRNGAISHRAITDHYQFVFWRNGGSSFRGSISDGWLPVWSNTVIAAECGWADC